MGSDRRRHRVTTDRQRRLSLSTSVAADVPAVISQSWNRSRRAGVVRDGSCTRLQYVEDLDLQRRLVQCAAPILDRLHDDLSGMPLSVALTDEHAQVMLRRDNDPALAARFDGIYFAPGFNYSEDVIGTNGVGTAVEAGMAVYVDGLQHFHESLRIFTCAGAPIHNPITGRFEGVVDISGLTRDANPLMRHLALGAARDIESALRSTGSAKQQLVLGAFLAACRRRQVAVYSLSCGVFMSNSIASRLLDPIDEAFLREQAHSLLTPSQCEQINMQLPSGRSISVKRTLVADGAGAAGVVLEVERAVDAASFPVARHSIPALPGSTGTSPQWNRCRGEVTALAAANANTILRGERASGRLSLARGAHLHKNPQAQIVVVECTAVAPPHETLVSALHSSATTVVLRDIDRLTPADDEALAHLVSAGQRNYPGRWIVATASPDGDGLLHSALAQTFAATVEVPALRHHPDDIPAIVRLHLARLAPYREADINDDALRTLKKYHWPGNVGELIAALKHALRAKPAGTITLADLPAAVHSAPRRMMTTLENAERDAIVAALRDCGGNRVEAAKRLGIARSSLYRKIHTYGIHL